MKTNIIIALLSVICGILGYMAAQMTTSEQAKTAQQTQIVAASPITQSNPTPSIPTTANNHDEIIDGGIIKPIKMPKYPESALKNGGDEGTTVIEVITDKSGKVTETNLAKSSEYISLDLTAKKAAQAEIYAPATSKGEPMRTRYYVQYTFRLPE